jgi:hypothetical protein
MLWITSVVPDQRLVQGIIQRVNLVAVAAILLFVMPAGNYADRVPSRFLIPASFLTSCMGLLFFEQVQDPIMNQLELYLVVIVIMIGGIFSMTSIETAYSRHLPKEVRGIMNGV